jgi:hypothetical protein
MGFSALSKSRSTFATLAFEGRATQTGMWFHICPENGLRRGALAMDPSSPCEAVKGTGGP